MPEQIFDANNIQQEQPTQTVQRASVKQHVPSFAEMMENKSNQLLDEIDSTPTKFESLGIKGPGVGYTSDGQVDNYIHQKAFNPEGFNPNDPKNHDRWVSRETWGTALSKGFDSFGDKFGSSYIGSAMSNIHIVDALVNFDWSKMMPTESDNIEQYYQDKILSNKNFVFVPENETDDIFGKKSISEFIGNAGYAVGTSMEFFTELAVDTLLTAITLPAGGEGAGLFAATFAKAAAKFGAKKIAKEGVEQGIKIAAKSNIADDIFKGMFDLSSQSVETIAKKGNKIGEVIDDAAKITRETKSGYNPLLRTKIAAANRWSESQLSKIISSKTFGEFAVNVAKGTPIIGTGFRYGEKIVKGAEVGLSGGKLLGIGLGGLRRIAQEVNMSGTEASFEAVSTYGETLDKMVNQYKADHNGENPDAISFNEMRTNALKASSSNYNTNMGILLATNSIQFGSMFNKFGIANKFIKDIAEEEAGNIISVVSKQGVKEFEKKFLGTFGILGQVKKEFGQKTALYYAGKATLKSVGKFEVTEGLQENLQEMSNSGWRDYYAGKYNGASKSLKQAFGDGLNSQFTKQGLKTFLMGAFTGTLIRGPMHVAQYGMQKFQEAAVNQQYKNNPEANPYSIIKKELRAGINMRNELYKKMADGKLEEITFNLAEQVKGSNNQTIAAGTNNKYEFINQQENVLLNGALSANRANTIDAYIESIKNVGQLTNEQFKEAYGIDISQTEYSTVQDFANSVAKDVKKYSDTVDQIRKKVNTSVDPMLYNRGSKEYYTSMALRNAQEDFVKILAYHSIKSEMAVTRAKKVANDLQSIPGVANSSAYILRVLTNQENLKGEIGNLVAEMKSLEKSIATTEDSSLKNKLKKDLDKKTKQKELLDKWANYYSKTEVNTKKVKNDKGEEVEESEVIPSKFIGKKSLDKHDLLDEEGNKIGESNDMYVSDHPEIIETFTAIVNNQNEEFGLDARISLNAIQDAHEKLIDYIKLDGDAKSYLNAVDHLFNPDLMKSIIERMEDGKYKANLLQFADTLKDRILYMVVKELQANTITQEQAVDLYTTIEGIITESSEYQNILLLANNDNLSINSSEYAQSLIDSLLKTIEKKINEITGVEEVVESSAINPEKEGIAHTEEQEGKAKDDVENKTSTDWNSLIEKAETEKELNAIQDQIIQAEEDSPILTDAIAVKREKISPVKESAFEVVGNEETGFAIKDQHELEVPLKVEPKTLAQAEKIALSLTISLEDQKWAQERLDKVSNTPDGKILVSAADVILLAHEMRKTLDEYNKSNDLKYDSIDEFDKGKHKNEKGKVIVHKNFSRDIISKIFNKTLVPTEQHKNAVIVDVVIENTEPIIAPEKSEDLNSSSLTNFTSKVEKPDNAIVKPEESSTFVLKDNVIEEDIDSIIDDINPCK